MGGRGKRSRVEEREVRLFLPLPPPSWVIWQPGLIVGAPPVQSPYIVNPPSPQAPLLQEPPAVWEPPPVGTLLLWEPSN